MLHLRATIVAPALALSLLAAACGDDDDDAAPTTTATTGEAEAPEAPGDGAVAVEAVDFAFEGLPAQLDAGATLTLHNSSSAELHELVLFRLPDDETRSLDELVALPPEELEAVFAGPPTMVLIAPPGEDGFPVVGDGTVTDAGRYAAMCFIPTGADPQAYLEAAQNSVGPPDVEGGPPHFTAGMYQEVTVG